MLYTVIPLDDVLEGIEQEPPSTVEVVVDGITMQVEPLGNFSGRVQRIISSDPNAYLDSRYQPGSVLRWT